MRLENKTALITGAASGIGRQSALLFAREGARVVIVDLNKEQGKDTVAEIKASGGLAHFVRADVSRSHDCQQMILAAEKAFGALDILFNNAGVMLAEDDDAVATEEEICDRTQAVNL